MTFNSVQKYWATAIHEFAGPYCTRFFDIFFSLVSKNAMHKEYVNNYYYFCLNAENF